MSDPLLMAAKEDLSALITLRRAIHREPELGFQEVKTADRVARELRKLDLSVRTGLGGTGVLGILDSGRPGPVTLLRADMDALSLQEENQSAYSSVHPGVMHACGHDVHCTWLVGAARLLVPFREQLQGKVLFLFQPAEESLGGAQKVLASGVLDEFSPDSVFGAHVWPMEVGQFLLVRGAALASSGHLRIVVTGKGGHGARPHLSRNPIPGAVAIVSALGTLLSSYRDPQQEELVNICSIRAGEQFNIVPQEAIIEGTMRCFTLQAMNEMEREIRNLAEHLAQGYGLHAQVQFRETYPPVINDSVMLQTAAQAIRHLTPEENLLFRDRGEMVAEDFSFYAQRYPSAYVMIGGGTDPLCRLHTPCFQVDESVLAYGAAYLAHCALLQGEMDQESCGQIPVKE